MTLEPEDEAALAHAGVARSVAPGEHLRLSEVGTVSVTVGTLDERTGPRPVARHERGALLNLERFFGRFGGAELVAVTPSAALLNHSRRSRYAKRSGVVFPRDRAECSRGPDPV